MVAPESCPGLLSSLQSSPPFLLNITAQEDSVMAWEPTYLLSPVLLLLLASGEDRDKDRGKKPG